MMVNPIIISILKVVGKEVLIVVAGSVIKKIIKK